MTDRAAFVPGACRRCVIGPDEYANLVDAARLFAMRPTALARVLTVRGVRGALYEERRDR